MEPIALPFYTSHKTVQAGKIVELRPLQTALEGQPVITDLVVEVGDEKTIIRVSAEYVGKHKPQVGGYYVKYADGYESWSPGDVFESGYRPTVFVDAAPPPVETPTSEPSSPPTSTGEPNPHEGTPPTTPAPAEAGAVATAESKPAETPAE